MDPLSSDQVKEVATWAGGGGAFIAVVWRVLLAFRGDVRRDREGDVSQHGYEKLIKDLQATAERQETRLQAMDKQIEDMGKRISDEMTLRFAAQNESQKLRERVAFLERKIAKLEGRDVQPEGT